MIETKAILVAMVYLLDGGFIDGNSFPGYEPRDIGSMAACRNEVSRLNTASNKLPSSVKHVVYGCRQAPTDWQVPTAKIG